MTTRKRNEYLDLDSEDEDQLSSDYDSGAAEDVELSRIGKIHGAPNHSKRRKISNSSSASLDNSESDLEAELLSKKTSGQQAKSEDRPDSRPPSPLPTSALIAEDENTAVELPSAPDATNESNLNLSPPHHSSPTQPPTTTTTKPPLARPRASGVIYLSRIPPFMRPSTVRSLLSHHGPITRLFLTPEPPSSYLGRRARGGNKKKSYIDGWVEFSSRRDARVCTEAINAQTIGRKGGFYGNDVWNARYLKGFSWTDLMAGARAEEREREERVRIGLGREMRERKAFLSAVEKGRRDVAKREKREKKKAEKVNLAAGELGANANANTIQGKTKSTTSTVHPTANPPAQPSSTSESKSKSKSTPRPEMRFRQHALAPAAARARLSTSHTAGGGDGGRGGAGGDGNGELGSKSKGTGTSDGNREREREGMVTRVLRQIF